MEEPLITPTINYIWLKKDDFSTFNQGYIWSWIQNNPDLQHVIWTDFESFQIPSKLINHNKVVIKYTNDINILLDKYKELDFSKKAIDVYNNINFLGAKSDILRYIILYEYGGFYVDINDFECFKSINNLIYKYDFICGAEPLLCINEDSILINNAFIASKKNHIILYRMISLIGNIPINIHYFEDIPKWTNDDTYIGNLTGVILFREIVLGAFIDFTINTERSIVLPSTYLYPSCFYNEKYDHMIGFNNMKDLWVHEESIGAHYSEHSYLDLTK